MKKPNILLLFTDQQRFDTIGAHGNPIIRTPALDQLAGMGTSFTRAYTPCPVCVPARYAMLTGRMPFQSGCFDNGPMPETGMSLMERLKEQDYQTHGAGKMHFTFPKWGDTALWGFDGRDVSEEVEGATRDDFHMFLEQNGYGYVKDPHGVRSEMYYIPQPSQLPERLHNSAWVADRSIEFLKGRDPHRPFFLMSSFIKPHPPFESPTPWNKLYRGPEMPLPKRPQDAEQLITYWNRHQNRYKYRDQGIDDHLIRCMKAAYYGAISFLDYQIGRILAYMRQSGLMENTIILFTSDHGELLGDYNCFGKRSFLDSAARVPMIMVSPGAQGGAFCDTPVSLMDVAPTLLQAAGLQKPQDMLGESLSDIAQGNIHRDMVTGQFQSNGAGLHMAVTQRYKYIYSEPDQREWLFDLRLDPQETRSRAGLTAYQGVVRKLRERLMKQYRQNGFTQPLDGQEWRKYPVRSVEADPDAGLLYQDPEPSLPHIPGYERALEDI